MEYTFDFEDLNSNQFNNIIALMTAVRDKKFSEKFTKFFSWEHKSYVYRVVKTSGVVYLEDVTGICAMLMDDGLIDVFDI